eukprot:TRINITY_DN75100_c0_g1_i1.p1 TRINITY_DN75100_c0_g1~~TRINITY_DN75100_c0_g1_i1.p1  ORF type:complete len:427 (+),score=40.58 TRINITY_DN75100_c0_g1_i1:101-1282(+)
MAVVGVSPGHRIWHAERRRTSFLVAVVVSAQLSSNWRHCNGWAPTCHGLSWTGPGLPHAEPVVLTRRRLLETSFAGAGALVVASQQVWAEDGPVFRMQKEAPRVDRTLAVLLLRTTYETIEGWGVYKDMQEYQIAFSNSRSRAMRSFRDRYANYDLSDLLDPEKVVASGGGVNNKLYFGFLNEVQWRTIAKKILTNREAFGRLIGYRLYKSIAEGFEVRAAVDNPRPDLSPECFEQRAGEKPKLKAVSTCDELIGIVPKLTPALPAGTAASDIRKGAGQLLDYLCGLGYCEGHELSDVTEEKGRVLFTAFVKEPVNLDATSALMRSNDNFVPRYDQRILQAYFSERSYESEFTDQLANSLNEAPDDKPGIARKVGVLTRWRLIPDPDVKGRYA